MFKQTQSRTGAMHIGWTSAIVGWSLGIVGVMWWMTNYEFSTDEHPTNATVTNWPTDSVLKLSSTKPTLVFFMHPKCPCTRASLTELHKLLEASAITDAELPKVIVVVSQPHDADAAWADTDTVRNAVLLPRAITFADVDSLEAERFGAVTSGMVLLFDTAGKRLFAGGVTASRGHEGDSAGGVMLRQLLKREVVAATPTVPTFGCKLCSRGESAASGGECPGGCREPLP